MNSLCDIFVMRQLDSARKLTKIMFDKGTEWYLTVNEMKKQETELLPNEQSNLRLRMLKVKPLSTRIE